MIAQQIYGVPMGLIVKTLDDALMGIVYRINQPVKRPRPPSSARHTQVALATDSLAAVIVLLYACPFLRTPASA